MAGETGDGWPLGVPRQRPYGVDSDQLGEFAFELGEYLAAPNAEMPYAPGETPCWSDNDRLAFAHLWDFERSVLRLKDGFGESVAAGREPAKRFGERFPNLVQFHTALPFNSAERWWFRAQNQIVWGLLEEDSKVKWHGGPLPFDKKIMELAGYRDMDGADIVYRWAAWRRDAEEYVGLGQLTAALEALSRLGRELLLGDIDAPPRA